MAEHSPPLHKPDFLPNKNIFLILLFLLLSIILASTVALANENRVTVQADVLNVRMGPGLSHDVLSQAQQNDRLHVLGQENQWYKVRLSNDQIGWVASWLVESDEVSADSQEFGRVTGSSVNIRQFASTDSDIIGTVVEGAELQILYQENDWLQVMYMGRVAWIHSDYIERIDSTTGTSEQVESETIQEVVTHSRTNIRTEPSEEASIVTTADSNSRFIYLGSENDWYEIQLNENETGYVASWVVDLEEVSTLDEQAVESQINRTTASNISEATIVIDPGHGGRDPGAISSTGFTESEVALDTSLLLQQRLNDAGANVIMTRSEDEFISLYERAVISESSYADAFISIHYDAMPVPNSMTGTTTYYYQENERALADTINRYLDSHGPLPNNGVRHGDYLVLRQNNRPSILLELGYMNHDHDVTLINTHSYQASVVEAIYQGLREHFAQ